MKNIAICMNNDKVLIDQLKQVKNILDLDETHVTIISIIKLNTLTFNLDPYIFPQEIHFELIKYKTLELMHELGKSLNLNESQISYEFEFDFNPKQYIQTLLGKAKMELIVTAVKEKHGIKGMFSSSFVDHFIKFSPCNVLVIRPTP